jgi:hypothetical protein
VFRGPRPRAQRAGCSQTPPLPAASGSVGEIERMLLGLVSTQFFLPPPHPAPGPPNVLIGHMFAVSPNLTPRNPRIQRDFVGKYYTTVLQISPIGLSFVLIWAVGPSIKRASLFFTGVTVSHRRHLNGPLVEADPKFFSSSVPQQVRNLLKRVFCAPCNSSSLPARICMGSRCPLRVFTYVSSVEFSPASWCFCSNSNQQEASRRSALTGLAGPSLNRTDYSFIYI